MALQFEAASEAIYIELVDHVEAKGLRGRRGMAADGEQLSWPAGVGVRPRRRHGPGARQGGAASPGVLGEPLPKEGIAGPPHAHPVHGTISSAGGYARGRETGRR